MHRYQLLIEYDGTKFVGWQAQKKGKSIQSSIQSQLSKLLKKKILIYGSGRTDAGVHALNQSAHFDIDSVIKDKNKLIKSINFFLNSKGIAIIDLKKKNKNFHARYSAKERIYRYIILNRFSPSTIEPNRAWHIRKKLDLKLITQGAKKISGTYDFSTFQASNCYSKSPIRTLKKVNIRSNNQKIIIEFKSKSFLRNQVRSMVGCLVYLGKKKWNLNKFVSVFKSKKRSLCAPPAPSHGLYLIKVSY